MRSNGVWLFGVISFGHLAKIQRLCGRHEQSQLIDFQLVGFVPRAGIEPARPFRAKGFSYHYDFRHQDGAAVPVWGLDYSFTIGQDPLGVSCLVSAPSSFRKLGSRLPSAPSGKVSLNLRHSTSLLSESALNFALPR